MRFSLRAWCLVLMAFALIFLPGVMPSARAQIITNGGFESGSTGWSFTGGSAVTAGNVLTPAHSGNFYATLANGGGTITQAVNIPTAGTYQLQFFLAPAVSLSLGTLNFSVTIGGVTTNLTYAVTVVGLGGYNLYTVTATLSAGLTNLVFTNLPGTLTAPLRLDDVSLTQIPGPVPGIGMLSYLVVILFGLLLGRKRLLNIFLRLKSVYLGHDR
jgi:hypothetical protein